MNWVLASLALFFHVLLPVLLAALCLRKPRSRLEAIVGLTGFAAYELVLFLVGGGWAMLGTWTRYGVAAICVVGIVTGACKLLRAPGWPNGLRRWLVTGGKSVLALMLAFIAVAVVDGSERPAEPGIELPWPLAGARYMVVHGGASPTHNAHAVVEAQRYALDIVAMSPLGFRATGFFPQELERYAIYDAAVSAPCTGEIVGVCSDVENAVPPSPGDGHPAGNYVAIHCDGLDATILLAHLVPGSVVAAVGDRVESGQLVGRVGNTGNSSEPHLHVHAVRGRVTELDEIAVSGRPVPIFFDGRFLVRNDVVDRGDARDADGVAPR